MKINLLGALLSIASLSAQPQSHDLTIVGRVAFGDGFSRISVGLADHLKDDFKLDIIATYLDAFHVPDTVKTLISRKYRSKPRVSMLVDHLWNTDINPSIFMPDSAIKICYSMHESTEIPPQWVAIINSKFDAVVVPDPWLMEVYQSCGVKKPIFVIPLGLYLEDFFKVPEKKQRQKKFVFGMSAGFWHRKNYILLLDAFAQAFGNNADVSLKLHGRFGDQSVIKDIEKKISDLRLKNVTILKGVLNQEEYIAFLRSLDCYVLLSKGEGYSISPREALALGLPCIITDNTAHQVLCNSGFVRAVPARIEEPVEQIYIKSFNFHCGHYFNCTVDDAAAALKDVYTNYQPYLKKAQQGRIWVRRYGWNQIIPYFKALIKPKRVMLGTVNEISLDTITTSDAELVLKYQQMCKT